MVDRWPHVSTTCAIKITDLLIGVSMQVWSAMMSAAQLRQCLLYLVAYFMLNESEWCTNLRTYCQETPLLITSSLRTYFNVTGILQNE